MSESRDKKKSIGKEKNLKQVTWKNNSNDENFEEPEKSDKVNDVKSKRKWKQVAAKLNQPELENEEEEAEKFAELIKEGKSIYNKNHRNRFDEFGTEITPFHMREELEEGNLDDSGHYVFNKNKDYDPWYDSVKDEIKQKEIERMKRKRTNDQEEEEEKPEQNEENLKDFQYYGEEDLYYRDEKITKDELKEIDDEIKNNRLKLVDYLESNETVQQALNKLKPKVKQHKYQPQRKKQKVEENKEVEETKEISEEKAKKFQELLNIISKLTELSYFNVYSDSIKSISDSYGEKALLKWYYRTVSSDSTEEYGPFSTDEVKSWMDQKLLEDFEQTKFEFKVIKPGNKDRSTIEWITRDDPQLTNILN